MLDGPPALMGIATMIDKEKDIVVEIVQWRGRISCN
jgi:hypothetical protein